MPKPNTPKAKDWDHNCIGNGCRFVGCENQIHPAKPNTPLQSLIDEANATRKPTRGKFRSSERDQEWDAWRSLCQALLVAGAVTQADLDSPVGQSKTSGQRLMNQIRTWGDMRVRLETEG